MFGGGELRSMAQALPLREIFCNCSYLIFKVILFMPNNKFSTFVPILPLFDFPFSLGF